MGTTTHIEAEASGRLDRLRAGDAREQDTFFRSHWSEVYAICARILGDGPDAGDTTVDVLCDFLFGYVKTLKRPDAMRAYLRLMAVRRSLRLRKRQQRMGSQADTELLPDEQNPDPEEFAEMTLMQPRLAECLGRLTPKAQRVVRLRYGQELTGERIGEMVGGSKQYIGRLLRKSLEKLRDCLEQNGKVLEQSEGYAK